MLKEQEAAVKFGFHLLLLFDNAMLCYVDLQFGIKIARVCINAVNQVAHAHC